nr:retrovirus-related Pol polyprotein from transposon TNT 1-94 [Tanacetum cinerariifolium]
MTGNKSFLTEYQEIDGGFVAFGGSSKGGKITRKGKIRTRKLDFEDLYFVKELKFNLFSVLQIVLVTKPHNKTPYELLIGRSPSLEFMRPFGCPVTILNTLDHLGKFDGKAGEGFLVGYSVNSKAFRVFNSRNRKVKENLIQTDIHAGQASQEKAAVHEYILLPFIPSNPPLFSTIQSSDVNAGDKPRDVNAGDIQGDVNAGDIQGDVNEISRNDD